MKSILSAIGRFFLCAFFTACALFAQAAEKKPNFIFIIADRPPSVFGYHFAKAVHQPGVPLGLLNLGGDSPPLTWISLEGMQGVTGFEEKRDEINLAYPNTESAKKALTAYIADFKSYAASISDLRKAGEEIPDALAAAIPNFPSPPYNQWVGYTETATHTS